MSNNNGCKCKACGSEAKLYGGYCLKCFQIVKMKADESNEDMSLYEPFSMSDEELAEYVTKQRALFHELILEIRDKNKSKEKNKERLTVVGFKKD